MISGFLKVLFIQATTNQIGLESRASDKSDQSESKAKADEFVQAPDKEADREKVAREILEKLRKLKESKNKSKSNNKSKSDNTGDVQGPDVKKKPPEEIKKSNKEEVKETEEIKKTDKEEVKETVGIRKPNKNGQRLEISENHYRLIESYPDEEKHVSEEYKNGKLISRRTNDFDYTKVIEEYWESGKYTRQETEYEKKTTDKKRVVLYINEKKQLEEIFDKSNLYPVIERKYDSNGKLSAETKFAKYLNKEYIKDFSTNQEFYFNPENGKPLYTVKKDTSGAIETLWMYKADGKTTHIPATLAGIVNNVTTLEEINLIYSLIDKGYIKISKNDIRIKQHEAFLNKIADRAKKIKETYDITVHVNPPANDFHYDFILLPLGEHIGALDKLEAILKRYPKELYEEKGLNIYLYANITGKNNGPVIAGLGNISLATSGMINEVFDHEITHYFDDDSMDEDWMGVYGGKDKYPGNKGFNKFRDENYSLESGFPSKYSMVNCTEHRAEIGGMLLNPQRIGELLTLKDGELYSHDKKVLNLCMQLIYMFEKKSKGMLDEQYFKDLIRHKTAISWNQYFENKRNKLRAAQQTFKKAA